MSQVSFCKSRSLLTSLLEYVIGLPYKHFNLKSLKIFISVYTKLYLQYLVIQYLVSKSPSISKVIFSCFYDFGGKYHSAKIFAVEWKNWYFHKKVMVPLNIIQNCGLLRCPKLQPIQNCKIDKALHKVVWV